jgi:hypothetical protein
MSEITMKVPDNLHIKMQSHPAIKTNILEISRNTGMTLAVQIIAAALHDYVQKVRTVPVLTEGGKRAARP